MKDNNFEKLFDIILLFRESSNNDKFNIAVHAQRQAVYVHIAHASEHCH